MSLTIDHLQGIGSPFETLFESIERRAYVGNESMAGIPAEILRQGLTIAQDLIPTLPPASLDTGEIVAYFDALINSLNTAIYDAHLNDIENGGYGLDPNDEETLWERERERENINAQLALEEVKRNYSMSGFPIPIGAMNKAMERAIQLSLEKNSTINRDISIKRADLYMRGKEFALTGGLAANQQLLAKISDMAKIHAVLDQVSVETRARIIAAALSMCNLNTSIAAHTTFTQSEQVSAHDQTSNNYSRSDSVSQSANTNRNINVESD